jgi:hypothetical protein
MLFSFLLNLSQLILKLKLMTNLEIAFRIVRDSRMSKTWKEKYGRENVFSIKAQLDKLTEADWSKTMLLCYNNNKGLFLQESKRG